jgi:sulfite reductase (NADPH) hemoprotein beta-component
MDLENAGEAAILERLQAIIAHYAKDRRAGEPFGDFTVRAGYVPEVRAGRDFNA